ncbi:hypothetical protein EYS14_14165 [Alteromonadaceae bacterium M269]|nr:hypothetical protein EYS14_14165 [Alteromonadaceae bacterium M269]
MDTTQKAVRSSVVIVIATWLKRVIGIVSIILLARFLGPSDYGIVAIGLLVLRFLEVVSETGINQYVLSRKEISDSELNTAWTLKLVTRIVLSILLITLSQPFAQFFENPELVVVFIALAFVPLIQGLESPSSLILSRALEYKKIAILTIVAKLTSFAVTLTLAIVYQSYWALIIGDLVLAVTTTTLSYFILSYKPKFTLNNWRKQWEFSQWILYKGIVGYSRAKFDVFIIGKYFDEVQTGLYTMSKHLILMPYDMIAAPVINIMITTISKETQNESKVRDLITLLIYAMICIMLPIVAMIILVTPFAIPFLLGDQWIDATLLIQIMIVISLFTAINSVIISAMNAFQIVKSIFMLDLLTFLITAITVYIVRDSTLEEFSVVQSILSLCTVSLFLIVIKRFCNIPMLSLLVALIPSFASVYICYLGVQLSDIEITLQMGLLEFIGVALLVTALYLLSFGLLSSVFSKFSKENAALIGYVLKIGAVDKIVRKLRKT